MEYSIKPKSLGERRIIHYPQKRIIGLYENVMVELITNVNNAVNGFVWGVPMLVLLVGTGILMTVLT